MEVKKEKKKTNPKTITALFLSLTASPGWSCLTDKSHAERDASRRGESGDEHQSVSRGDINIFPSSAPHSFPSASDSQRVVAQSPRIKSTAAWQMHANTICAARVRERWWWSLLLLIDNARGGVRLWKHICWRSAATLRFTTYSAVKFGA